VGTVRTVEFGYLTPETLPLFTDLYELTMTQGYYRGDHTPRATFSLFVRDLPPDRGYLLAAGLEQAVHAVESLSFGDRALAYLREQGFGESFLEELASLSFSGDVRAVPEGTPVFANEPLVEVTAPIPEAQLLETVLINQVGVQTLVATKAARMRDVVVRRGDGQALVDFGSRRAHGTDAGLKAARAAYLAGFDGTSNVAAGEAFGLPVSGTMAHSWVQSFPDEQTAFETFLAVYGDESVLLVDTYDTVEGARTAAAVAAEMGIDPRGLRLDSGDLPTLSREVTAALAAADAGVDPDLFISSGIDEYAIEEFFERGGIAAGFGPGTALVTSADAPTVEGVYKLVAVEEGGEMAPTMKLSAGKVTYPGAKSVRRVEADGVYVRDVLDRRGTSGPGEELLETVIEDGERVRELPTLAEARERALREVGRLPESVRAVRDPADYEVTVGEALEAETDALRERLEDRYGD
jgi:nicotinate phosphoribosyltransferase